jgi:hypothetical protein
MKSVQPDAFTSHLVRCLADCDSLAATERWLARFRDSDLSRDDKQRSEHPTVACFEKFPFASTSNSSVQRFVVILRRDLWLQNCSRERIPYHRIVVQRFWEFDFEGVTTWSRVLVSRRIWFWFDVRSIHPCCHSEPPKGTVIDLMSGTWFN